MGPTNGNGQPDEQTSSDRFADMGELPEKAQEIHKFSQVFRTYDVFNQTGTATTLDRTAYFLQKQGGLLTCENHVRIASSLQPSGFY